MKRSTRRLIAAFRRERLNMVCTRHIRAVLLWRFRRERGSAYVRRIHLA